MNDRDKPAVVPVAKRLADLGFHILATQGTQEFLVDVGIQAKHIFKIQEGRPHVVDAIKNKGIDLMVNTPAGEKSQAYDLQIRRAAVQFGIPYTTTLSGAAAVVAGIESQRKEGSIRVRTLQEFHQREVSPPR